MYVQLLVNISVLITDCVSQVSLTVVFFVFVFMLIALKKLTQECTAPHTMQNVYNTILTNGNTYTEEYIYKIFSSCVQ